MYPEKENPPVDNYILLQVRKLVNLLNVAEEKLARFLGLEPRSAVLETVVLPIELKPHKT